MYINYVYYLIQLQSVKIEALCNLCLGIKQFCLGFFFWYVSVCKVFQMVNYIML